MASLPDPLFVPVGESDARLFGIGARDRAMRIAANLGLDTAQVADATRPVIAAAMGFAWDPAWLKHLRTRPASVLLFGNVPVLAHLPAGKGQAKAIADIAAGKVPAGLEIIDSATAELNYAELRKRERPFVMAIDPADPEPVERALYDAAYKGVTDLLTLYLWRKPAFHLTRWAAHAGLSPNSVTAVGALFCLLAFLGFWTGHYWLGLATGFVFMVLDTVDGKLARCTGASSKWGDVFDHGIDLIHPPFWYWAWAHGLGVVGLTMEPVLTTMVLWAIIGGYVLQRVIEGLFIYRYNGLEIHVWKAIDSRFRLITARRNPNMVILFASLLIARPDLGLQWVAIWTLFSLAFHAVRLAQAREAEARGVAITSWLA